MPIAKIALVGRTNVGKSTLFNALIGRKKAIVHDQKNLTRDRKYEKLELKKAKTVEIIDTAGLEPGKDELSRKMWQQTMEAVKESALVLFILDAKDGVTALDKELARKLRTENGSILLVANKCEQKRETEKIQSEAAALGFGMPLCVSAEHRIGIEELKKEIDTLLPEGEEIMEEGEESKPLKIAILGKPNAGKSTYINALLGQERVIASDIAGTTRDTIEIPFDYQGKKIILTDTAGLRRKSKVDTKVESVAALKARESANFSHVVLLLLDATLGIEKQDLQIADDMIEEGRIVVLVFNKWDLVEDKNAMMEHIKYRLSLSLGQLKDVRFAYVSAKDSKNIFKPVDESIALYEKWNTRVSTNKMNNWLLEATSKNPPPHGKTGSRQSFKYMTQIKTRPPTFVIFQSQKESLPETYERYLRNSIKETFDFKGVPIRMLFRKRENPFDKKS